MKYKIEDIDWFNFVDHKKKTYLICKFKDGCGLKALPSEAEKIYLGASLFSNDEPEIFYNYTQKEILKLANNV
jgi:hypothetical protein